MLKKDPKFHFAKYARKSTAPRQRLAGELSFEYHRQSSKLGRVHIHAQLNYNEIISEILLLKAFQPISHLDFNLKMQRFMVQFHYLVRVVQY